MNWNKFFFLLAATCWVLAVVTNLTAWLAHYDMSRIFPPLFVLHIGVFVVWIPAFILLIERQQKSENPLSKRIQLKVVLRDTPWWLISIAGLGMVYAMYNWAGFVANNEGNPEFRDGQYLLMEHANVIRTITLDEYNSAQANITRGFSGHWVAFYGSAAAILYPFGIRNGTPPVVSQAESPPLS